MVTRRGSTSLLLRKALLDGDRRSLGLAVERLSPLLMNHATFHLRDFKDIGVTPEDIVHDAFLAFLESGDFEALGDRVTPSVVRYLGQIIRNRIRNVVRDSFKNRHHDLDSRTAATGVSAEPPLVTLIRAERNGLLGQVLSSLSDRQRQIALMRSVDGLRFKEIAELLAFDGCPLSEEAAKKQFQRAIGILRDRLPDHLFEPFFATNGSD